jgi:hypothetical protein
MSKESELPQPQKVEYKYVLKKAISYCFVPIILEMWTNWTQKNQQQKYELIFDKNGLPTQGAWQVLVAILFNIALFLGYAYLIYFKIESPYFGLKAVCLWMLACICMQFANRIGIVILGGIWMAVEVTQEWGNARNHWWVFSIANCLTNAVVYLAIWWRHGAEEGNSVDNFVFYWTVLNFFVQFLGMSIAFYLKNIDFEQPTEEILDDEGI